MHRHFRRSAPGAALLLGLLALAGCDQELPTDVGGEHLPESALRTYEVILQDFEFLAGDSLVRGFGTNTTSSLLIVAENYLDTLDAHAVARFGAFPVSVSYSDSGTTVVDTVSRYVGGRIVLRVDTLSLDTLANDSLITFQMFQLAETFDARTATWRARRVDGISDTTFWAVPGGTPGPLIGTRIWTRSDTLLRDSVVFDIDSATIANWAASADSMRAVLITTTTPGIRAQVLIPRLQLIARTRLQPDTTRTTSAVLMAQTYLIDPPPPAPMNELRLGDRSAWRAFLQFADRLDTMSIACPGVPDCSFTLGEVTVNRAELQLRPLEVSRVYRPRETLVIEARPVLGEEALPLERAPLGDTTGVGLRVTPEYFVADSDSLVRVGATRFVRSLLGVGEDTTITARNRTLALVTLPEPVSFGILRFGAPGSGATAPVLRLVVTVPVRDEEEE